MGGNCPHEKEKKIAKKYGYTIKKRHKRKQRMQGGIQSNEQFTWFKFNDDLTTLQVCNLHDGRDMNWNDEHTHTIQNPTRMTDVDKAICAGVQQDDAVKMYSYNATRLIEYDNVSIHFNQFKYPSVFGPNIDTLLVCKGLKSADLTECKTFLEIGAGSGFITKYVKSKNPKLIGTIIDIDENSIFCSIENNGFNQDQLQRVQIFDNTFKRYEFTEKQMTYVVGDAIQYIQNDNRNSTTYDLVISNPPYIPRGHENDFGNEKLTIQNIDPTNLPSNFFEGTYLMRFILTNFSCFCKNQLIMLISSTSFCVESLCTLLGDFEIDILCSMDVPFTVYDTETQKWLNDDKDWMKFLEDKEDIKTAEKNFKRGVKKIAETNSYTHTIYVVKLNKRI
jgi:hypothetical protein